VFAAFQIEKVTKSEYAHVFKFEAAISTSPLRAKGMRGNFEHLRKDQLSALGSLVTDFVGDMGLILLRERR
jgi:hypothetical protein